MTQAYYRRKTCRLCEQAKLELVLNLGTTPPGDHYIGKDRLNVKQETYPLDLVFCTHCGLLQLPDVIAPEILYGNYIYCTSISLGLTEHFQKYADVVLAGVNPPKDTLIMDIGSNDGTLLQAFKKRGFRVLGVDPAREVAKKASDAGVATIVDFFTPELSRKIKKEHGSAAIVTANNVFANIDDVRNMIAGVRELLSDDGVFVFETGYMADLVQKKIIDNIYHEHISYYSASPLNAFFKSQGMQLFDIEHVPTKGGSIRGMVQLEGGPRRVTPAVAEMMQAEKQAGLTTMAPFHWFAKNTEAIKAELLSDLKELKAQGRSIAGYGASVGMTTLIYYFGLSELLDFLVDDNPVRHNLYSPGHHIPVLPSEALNERKPGCLVLLAWQYAEPILNKHQQYLAQGGKVIIPLPEIKRIGF